MKTIAIIIGICMAFASLAQVTIERSVIASAGFASPTLSFTIGEPMTETAIAGSIVLTQGFQQPDTVLRVGIGTLPYANMAIQLYPNPTNGRINLQFTDPSNDAVYTLSVKNILGQNCIAFPALQAPTVAPLDVSSLSAGLYYLHIDDGQNHRSIIKFQKID